MISKLGKIESQYGPQSHSDYSFQRKARLLQSWYRTTTLGVSCGYGPYPKSNKLYGNMLMEGGGNLAGFPNITKGSFVKHNNRIRRNNCSFFI